MAGAGRLSGVFRRVGAAATGSASPQDGTDIYAADLRIDGADQVANHPQVRRLTDTPAGDETAPVLAGAWLAFATRWVTAISP